MRKAQLQRQIERARSSERDLADLPQQSVFEALDQLAVELEEAEVGEDLDLLQDKLYSIEAEQNSRLEPDPRRS